jgi:hypothetical protein
VTLAGRAVIRETEWKKADLKGAGYNWADTREAS